MAQPRQLPSGSWEITLRHPALPQGRKSFTFPTREEAEGYAAQWQLMKAAGRQPPAEYLVPAVTRSVPLTRVLLDWENSGEPAPSAKPALNKLREEVGAVLLHDADYHWLEGYVRRLKVTNNLTPSTIRQRVQALSRAINYHLRKHPKSGAQNPCLLLPKGYSAYSTVDREVVKAAGKQVRDNVIRDRRLKPGEQERIERVLSGWCRPDRERALELRGGDALLTLFRVILGTGLRLLEAYRLRVDQVDLQARVIRAQKSKLWRGKVAFREVPIRPEVAQALKDYLASRDLAPGAYLFPFLDEDGGLDQKTCSQRLSFRFRIAFEYAGCAGLREHDLRHEATCRWFELRDAAGGWLYRREEVCAIMGWAPGSPMAERYASFRAEDLARRLYQQAA